MNTGTVLDLVIGGCTIVLSLTGSAFIAGSRWSRMESSISTMSDRLAKIEGMFTLRFRDPRGE